MAEEIEHETGGDIVSEYALVIPIIWVLVIARPIVSLPFILDVLLVLQGRNRIRVRNHKCIDELLLDLEAASQLKACSITLLWTVLLVGHPRNIHAVRLK